MTDNDREVVLIGAMLVGSVLVAVKIPSTYCV